MFTKSTLNVRAHSANAMNTIQINYHQNHAIVRLIAAKIFVDFSRDAGRNPDQLLHESRVDNQPFVYYPAKSSSSLQFVVLSMTIHVWC